MTTLAQPPISVASKEIQVSGFTCFQESRWRDAILHYLFGIWSGDSRVTYRPKIAFGDIELRLDRSTHQYYAYGHEQAAELIPNRVKGRYLLETTGRQNEVETALIRFVKNNRILQLELRLPMSHCGDLVLWKKARRGEYGYAGVGLPYTWGTNGPVWTREEFERWFSGDHH